MADDVELLGSYWTLAGAADPRGRDWSPVPFEDRVALAAEVGFAGIGLWHADLEHLLETHSIAELGAVLDRHGVELMELEWLDNWFLERDDERRRVSDVRRETMLAVADELDVRHLKIGNRSRLDRPMTQFVEGFGELCDDAAAVGTRVGHEFIAGEGTINDFGAALEMVRRADRDNGGLVLDVWHVVRLGLDYDALRRLEPGELVSVELNDGLLDPPDREGETVNHRLVPGEGEFDLDGFVEAVRAVGYDGPWGVEVLNEGLRGEPIGSVYPRVHDAAMAQLT